MIYLFNNIFIQQLDNYNHRGDYDDGELNDGGLSDGGHFHGGYGDDEICGLYGLRYGGGGGDLQYVRQSASF